MSDPGADRAGPSRPDPERSRAGSAAAGGAVRRRSDGEATHAAILDAAMRLASIEGLGSLTLGRLARELDISKSGVFAHFRSKWRLQQETVQAAEAVLAREVIDPARAEPEGLAQLEALCECYLSYVEREVFPGGCFFAQLFAEFDATADRLHDMVVAGHTNWHGLFAGMVADAQRRGEIDPDVEPDQLAFELYAHLEGANYVATLHRDPGLVDRGRRAVHATLARARTPSPS